MMTMPFETIFSLLVIQGIFHLLNGCESVGPFQNLVGLDLSYGKTQNPWLYYHFLSLKK